MIAPMQQQRDRDVAEDRKPGHRRQQRRAGAQREHRAGRPQRAAERLQRIEFRAGLERQRGLDARGFACRYPAAGDRRGDAEHEEGEGPTRADGQPRLCAGKESAAQIAAERRQRQCRERDAECEAEQAADHAGNDRLDDEQTLQFACRHSADAQERQLGAPRDHRLRLQREHEEGAGEERDQCKHVEVDPVRARDVRDALRGLVRAY